MARVLIPIPARDFDPTEVAVPWRTLARLGHTVVFATPDGKPGVADELMLTGEGLDVWGFLPLAKKLILAGAILRANRAARAAYAEMSASADFANPKSWKDMSREPFDGLILPGGHRARGMRQYLESPVVQQVAAESMRVEKPVGAICHGVLVLARAREPSMGRSPLFGRKTTALTWALERSAASLARVTRFWDPHYYRTYRERAGEPTGFMSVEREVTRALANPSDFVDVPENDPSYRRKISGLARDSEGDFSPSFVCRDGAYVSARWPGDAHAFAASFASLL